MLLLFLSVDTFYELTSKNYMLSSQNHHDYEKDCFKMSNKIIFIERQMAARGPNPVQIFFLRSARDFVKKSCCMFVVYVMNII